MKILHISDTHFHHDDSNNIDIMKRIRAIKEGFPNHLVICTGDITDDGRSDQYEKATQALDTLNPIILPGNHDYGPLGSFYNVEDAKSFDSFAFAFGENPFFNKIPVIIKKENVLFILLNSCLETQDLFDFACGSIGRKQLMYLKAILDDVTYCEMVKIVALHHHPFLHSDPGMMLLDADQLLRVCYKKTDIMLFGHKHEEGMWFNKSGVKFILAADALYCDNCVKEIVIEGNEISVNKVQLI